MDCTPKRSVEVATVPPGAGVERFQCLGERAFEPGKVVGLTVVMGGQVVGSTNSRGEFPRERPLTPQDLLATSYRHLGIDSRHEFRDFGGRPVPILSGGQPIAELI